jgi:hypothetical protein
VSRRRLGLVAIGAAFVLVSVLLLAGGEVVIGVMGLLFGSMAIVVVAAERAPDGSGPKLEDGALVIRVARLRRILLVLGALLFTAVSALLQLTGALIAQIAGALGVLTFGTFTVVGLWQLRGPYRLVVTPQALRWDQGGEGPSVAWDDVKRVGMLVISGTPTLTIDVKRPQELRRGAVGRWLARANRRLGGGDVNVPLNQLSVDDEFLLSLMTVCAREPEARSTIVTESTLRHLQA